MRALPLPVVPSRARPSVGRARPGGRAGAGRIDMAGAIAVAALVASTVLGGGALLGGCGRVGAATWTPRLVIEAGGVRRRAADDARAGRRWDLEARAALALRPETRRPPAHPAAGDLDPPPLRESPIPCRVPEACAWARRAAAGARAGLAWSGGGP